MTDAHSAPLLAALMQAAQRRQTPFYAPGHKQGSGAAEPLRRLIGDAALRADLPELPDLDNLFAPAGPIQAAQEFAAQTFGADATFFLANGSTCGIEAAVLATCQPGDPVLVPRNAHRSVLAALILAGAHPLWLRPIADPAWDLALGITAEQVAAALEQHPAIRVVIMVSPNYQGVCGDIRAIADCVHQHRGLLLVDEAHGAHLGFHPDLPTSALAQGADVVIQSTHKVLAALTQASMLHVQGHRVNRDRLRQALQLTQSTSPNYLLLASLDAARQQMAHAGLELMAQTLTLAQTVRSRLANLAPLHCLTDGDLAALPGNWQLDPTRLTIDVAALGITGYAADAFLHEQLNVTVELPTLHQLTLILSLGNRPEDGDRLVQSLAQLRQEAPNLTPASPLANREATAATTPPDLTEPPLSPRAAFFATSRCLPLVQAIGHISADALCPYPPGIPLLLPGERITAAAIAQLQQIHQAGGVITGLPDPDLQTLRIVDPG